MSKWRYREIKISGNTDLTRPNGMVLEHRYVAEQALGRSLKPEEVVHHIDKDRRNNKPENLVVFATLSDHARFHHGGVLVCQSDGTYTCEPRKHPCLQCGKLTINEKYCSYDCAHKARRIVQRPDKQQLAQDIESMSWLAVGRKYGVSDTTARKWARSYRLAS